MKFNKIRVNAAQIHLLHDVSSVTIGIEIQHILQASYYYSSLVQGMIHTTKITMINYYYV